MHLNDRQLDAVKHGNFPLLILAGVLYLAYFLYQKFLAKGERYEEISDDTDDIEDELDEDDDDDLTDLDDDDL